ncbi:MAG: hypothetical protein ACJATI_005618 [Halioglobus sp.]|jgi:hypothetical protein
MKHILIISMIVALMSCNKEPSFVTDLELPEVVDLGKSEVYLNNIIEDYNPRFFEDTVNNQLLLTFVFEPDFSVTNSLGFGALAVNENENILHTDRILYKGAKTTFHQIINGEFDGWQFDLVNPEDGHFNITKLDTVNQTVQGNFKAFFEVSDKNGYDDTKLPERVKFQGVFNDTYIRG